MHQDYHKSLLEPTILCIQIIMLLLCDSNNRFVKQKSERKQKHFKEVFIFQIDLTKFNFLLKITFSI